MKSVLLLFTALCCANASCRVVADAVAGVAVGAVVKRGEQVRIQEQRDNDPAGRWDWPCPPSCAAGFVCVHSELNRGGICRPACALDAPQTCRGMGRCTVVEGARPACVIGAGPARAEPFEPAVVAP